MRKFLATLALAGLAGGAFAGVASADQDVAGLGTAHEENGLVLEGNGSSIDGYVGVEGQNVVADCGDYDHSGTVLGSEEPDGVPACLDPTA